MVRRQCTFDWSAGAPCSARRVSAPASRCGRGAAPAAVLLCAASPGDSDSRTALSHETGVGRHRARGPAPPARRWLRPARPAKQRCAQSASASAVLGCWLRPGRADRPSLRHLTGLGSFRLHRQSSRWCPHHSPLMKAEGGVRFFVCWRPRRALPSVRRSAAAGAALITFGGRVSDAGSRSPIDTVGRVWPISASQSVTWEGRLGLVDPGC